MKNRWLFLWFACVVSLLASPVRGQEINRIEYFIDADPGVGSGMAAPFDAGAVVDAEFTVSLEGTSEGFHVLGVAPATALDSGV